MGDRVYDQLGLTGHLARLNDLDRFAALGLRTLRVCIAWERVETEPGVFDWSWADAMMRRLQQLGIRPIVGLVHHGSGPLRTDLTQDSFVAGLIDHAARVAARYPWVTDWTPVNEPLTTARFSCLYGLWHPHLKSEAAFWTALFGQIDATIGAMRAIRLHQPKARLIQTEDYGQTFATAPCAEQAEFENRRRLMTWDLLCGLVDADHPLGGYLNALGFEHRLAAVRSSPTPPDVIGVNYYVTSDRFLDHRLERYPAQLHGGNGRIAYADTEAVRALAGWRPGWRRYVERLHARYGLPIAVTECHLGSDADQQSAWLLQCWAAMQDAWQSGLPIEATTVWALAGSAGWDRLLTEDNGRYEPGVLDASLPGAPDTGLAQTVCDLASGDRRDGKVTGWWEQSERLTPIAASSNPDNDMHIQPLAESLS